MPDIDELRDREIMLSCLAEVADSVTDSDLVDGSPARLVVEARRRMSRRLRTTTLLLTSQPSARVAPASPRPVNSRPRQLGATLNRAAIERMLLDIRRGELAAHRFSAADLREGARALRAEAEQIRRTRHAAP